MVMHHLKQLLSYSSTSYACLFRAETCSGNLAVATMRDKVVVSKRVEGHGNLECECLAKPLLCVLSCHEAALLNMLDSSGSDLKVEGHP